MFLSSFFFHILFPQFLICSLCLLFLVGTFCLVPFVLMVAMVFWVFCQLSHLQLFFVFSTFLRKKTFVLKSLTFFLRFLFCQFLKKECLDSRKCFEKFEMCFTSPFCGKFLYHLFFSSSTFEKNLLYVFELCFWWTSLFFLFLRFSFLLLFILDFLFLFWWIFHFVHFFVQTKETSSCFSQF